MDVQPPAPPRQTSKAAQALAASAGAAPAATGPRPDGEKGYRAWPFWAPRFWHGMPLGVWLPLVAEHGGRADPSRWGLMVTITAAATFNSLIEPIANLRFRRQLASPPSTPPPLFILGHWRSGTTLLHELMMLDDRFCCPNYYQCYAPGHFLLTERALAPLVKLILPAKRPMDDMAAGLDRPQEDEFALMNLGAPSPYRRMAFPVTSPPSPEALDLTKLPAAELARWQATLRRFLGLLAVADPRRPVLKSPPHTARVGVLAGMFPESKFLHVVRDPQAVFHSTMKLWRSLHDGQGMQVDRGETLEAYVFAAFEEMYAAFERDRATLDPARLHEIRYEDLVADPVGRLREAYERLGLDDFEAVRPRLEKHAKGMKEYRAGSYRHDPRIAAEIARRWGPFLERYGYGCTGA